VRAGWSFGDDSRYRRHIATIRGSNDLLKHFRAEVIGRAQLDRRENSCTASRIVDGALRSSSGSNGLFSASNLRAYFSACFQLLGLRHGTQAAAVGQDAANPFWTAATSPDFLISHKATLDCLFVPIFLGEHLISEHRPRWTRALQSKLTRSEP
jgi:hypothetical protein